MSGCAQRDPYPAYEPPDRNLQPIKAKPIMPPPSKPLIEFTADDARQMVTRAKSIQDGFARVETEKCLQAIREAAAKGQTSCFIHVPDELLSLVCERLKSVGFQVHHCSDPREGETTTTVKW